MGSVGCKQTRKSAILSIFAFLTAGQLMATHEKSPGKSDNEAIVAKILSDWKHRQDTTLGFRYVADGQGIIPKGKLTGDPDLSPHIKGEFPPEDLVYDENESWVMDFATNKSRHEWRTQFIMLPEGKLAPNYTVHAYDGNSDKIFTPRAENTGPTHVPPPAQADLSEGSKESDRTLSPSWLPLFLAHGMPPEDFPVVEHPRVKVAPTRFRFHDRASFMGRDCVVLRTSPEPKGGSVDELWVDVQRRSAVTKFIRYRSVNDIYLQFEIQYRQDGEEWWPESWTENVFRYKMLRESYRRRVTEYAINPASDANLFKFELKPGMVYAKDVNKGEIFKVGQDGKSLTKIDIPFATSAKAEPSWWQSWWLLAVVALGVCAFGAWVVWSWQRRSARN